MYTRHSLRTLFLMLALLLAFSFLPAGVSAESAAPDAAPTSDNFDDCSLGSAWDYVQGQDGDPPPAFNGRQLVLTAPGGVDHDIWDYGILAQRIMQTVSDEDFEVEVEFASTMDSGFQTRGILVQAANGDILRLETYHDGTDYYHYATSIIGGVVRNPEYHREIVTGGEPAKIKVSRTGDTWVHAVLTAEGTQLATNTFDEPFVVDQIGPYIGNTSVNAPGSEPEHVGLIEYFDNTAARSPDDSGNNVHTLTLNETGNGTAVADPVQADYGCGQEVTLTATPDAEWIFDGWSGDLTGRDNPATVAMDADKTITANFVEEQPNTFQLDITFVGDGDVTRDPDKAAYDPGEEVTLTAVPDLGWTFDGWSGDESGEAVEITVTMDADKSIIATFVEATYTLNTPQSGNGVVTADPEKDEYDAGEEVELTAVAASGWEFDSWTGDYVGTDNPATITMDADKTVTAIFTEIPAETYILTVTEAGQGTVTKDPDQAEYEAGEEVTLTAAPAAGWTFVGWSGDVSSSETQIVITMDADKTITATFEAEQPETYTLTVTRNGDGAVTRSPDKSAYDAGEEVTLTATPAVGWSFDGWSGDAGGSSAQITVTMDTDKTVIATFTALLPASYLPVVAR